MRVAKADEIIFQGDPEAKKIWLPWQLKTHFFDVLVAKATSFPGSAGQSILARDGKCANFP
jgi:hypothetical protein